MRKKLYPVLLFVLAAAALLLLWQGGRVAASTVQPDAGSLALLPAQSNAIFGADLDGLRATALYGKWNAAHGQERDQHYNEFVAQTGFDPMRDVQGVTGAVWKDGEEGRALVVVIAHYNPASLSAFLKQHSEIATESYGGVELFIPAKETAGKDYGAVAFLDDRTIIAGNAAAVRQALDRRINPSQSVLANQALMARLNQISIENQVWAVTGATADFIHAPVSTTTAPTLPTGPALTLPGLPVPAQLQANLTRIMSGVQNSTFAVNAATGLRLLAQATCATEADAHTLAETGRGLLAMARLLAPANQPQALQVLNSVNIEQYGSDVKVTAQITPELLDQIAAGHEASALRQAHPSRERESHRPRQ